MLVESTLDELGSKTCIFEKKCNFASKILQSNETYIYIIICFAIAICAAAADVKIDKENCTITKDGKTYKLYGKVKIVDSFEDIKVKIVDSFEDIKIKIVNSFEGVKQSK